MNALVKEIPVSKVFYSGERAGRHYLPALLREAGVFERESTSWSDTNPDIRFQQRRDMFNSHVVDDEIAAILKRLGGVRALKYLVEDVFENHNLPKEDGMDIGSGGHGFMVKTLMKDVAPNFVESDINRNVIELRQGKDGNFVPASYYNLRDQVVDSDCLSIATGLSILGDTKFPQQIIASVRDALRSGGFFLHVQDLLPSLPVTFGALEAVSKDPYAMYEVENLGTGEAPWTVDVGDRRYSALELASINFASAAKKVDGMRIIFNEVCVAQVPSLNSRTDYVYQNGYRQAMACDQPFAIEQATALVTLMQKR